MAPRKRSYSEEARRLQQRSLIMTRKGQIAWVLKVLKEHQEFVPSVIAHLKNCGVQRPAPGSDAKEEVDTAPSEPASGTGMARPVGEASSGVEQASIDGSAPADASTNGEQSEDPSNDNSSMCYIPRKYASWEEVPGDYLIEILSSLEKASLSKAALRALVPKGKKALRREPLLEILEFATGQDRATPIRPGMRKMSEAIATFATMSEDRGRLARDIIMPVDWTQSGLNTISVVTEGQRGISLTSLLHQGNVFIPVDDAGIVLEDFQLEFNFSDTRAAIVHPCIASRMMCAVLFAGRCSLPSFPSPAPKAKPEAIVKDSTDAKAPEQPGQRACEKKKRATPTAGTSRAKAKTDERSVRPPPPKKLKAKVE